MPDVAQCHQKTFPRCPINVASFILMISVGLFGASNDCVSADDAIAPADLEFFESRIRPILAVHCYECHSADSKILRGGLRLDTRDGLRKGGDSGPGVVPGKVADSLLISALRHESFQMPPELKLPDRVISDFVTWIEKGAPDPRTQAAPAKLQPVDWEAAAKHWAFQPISDPVPPADAVNDWVRSPIDQFILQRLQREGLTPNGSADKRTLIRRATFDLIGLPPTVDEVNEFLADDSPQSFERVVDRLLESPHYGERWGRHWLDLVRYADTNGADENHAMPNAWRYRDWVVRMLNRDLPLDQFIVQQLAGDLLPVPDSEQEAGNLVTATGMLVVGPKMLAEQDKDKMIIDIVDEQIDTVSRTMLGLTIGCARCHDHKFDPISARDYYALAGIFSSTQTMADRAFVSRWMERPLPSKELDAQITEHKLKLEAAKSELNRLKALPEFAAAAAKLEKPTKAGRPDSTADTDSSTVAGSPESVLKTQAELVEQLEKDMPQHTLVMAVQEQQIQNLPVHIRGNHLTLSEDVVPRGMPVILTGVATAPKIPDSQSGRLQFANWLVAPEHPLTARVMANRIWMWHFGEPLMRSPSNFGLQAEPPDAPELLDWLARELIRRDWSLKEMHRLILLSATWQMRSDASPAQDELDPENRLWWRQNRRRLEAEAVRDSVLFVGGELDFTMGDKAADTESKRRAIYLPINRSALYEMFSTFDYVETGNHIEQRPTTTVPHQALFVLNSPMVHEQAKNLASQLLKERSGDVEGDPQPLVNAAFERLFARQPKNDELVRAEQFLNQVQAGLAGVEDPDERQLQVWSSLCRALMAANEFIYID